MSEATILIPARNAEKTLMRAFESSLSDTSAKIIIADHRSSDQTRKVVQNLSNERVLAYDASSCETIGEVRQALLDLADTEYVVWLDADDELLPGRVKRIIDSLKKNHADFYFDASELVLGNQKKTLPMPNFASNNPAAHCRNFERCFLPAPGVPGVRTEFAKKIGFDPDFETAEDYDFLLRASMSGGKFCFDPKVGYRQHHSSTSLSRNLDRQKKFTALALQKHPLEKIGRLYESNGWNKRIQAWGMVQIATFLSEYSDAIEKLDELESSLEDPDCILEPSGIYPYSEGWMINFWKGTLCLLQKKTKESIDYLSEAEKIMPSPETSNNLGVSYSILDKQDLANDSFKDALAKKADYLDAIENLRGECPPRVTKFPLRHFDTRSSYSEPWK